jgi:hypothetical protein
MPFWFLNDKLDPMELRRQLRAFRDAGLGGFVLHARVGLDPEVGYLTDEWFRLCRLVAEEARELDLKIVLYDEASYPSGSAQGRVVAENPNWATRCLVPVERRVQGPAEGVWRPNPGRSLDDELLGVYAARVVAEGSVDPASVERLAASEHDVVRYSVPAGAWILMSVWAVFTGATIRGAFSFEDSAHALAPPAGDIMNPDAVAAFLRYTHDAYYRHLQEHFGRTVVAMFTDEPNPLGRDVRRGPNPVPYTPGLLDDIPGLAADEVLDRLPLLWCQAGSASERFRRAYHGGVKRRIDRVFYAAQSRWCADHGIALTGHPAESNEMGALQRFHWPGQDMVWRYVEPGNTTALAGPHSVAPKAAASAAAVDARERNASELYGAYGWHLSLDEMKWLADWHLVRGTDLFMPHAAFYSIRGRRAFESEPDVGLHNALAPYYPQLWTHIRRTCWVLANTEPAAPVAVITDGENMGWRAAAALFRNQIDFLYLDYRKLHDVTVRDGKLAAGPCLFHLAVVDVPESLPSPAANRLAELTGTGARIVHTGNDEELLAAVEAALPNRLRWSGSDTVRVNRRRAPGSEYAVVGNEGEHAVEGDLALPGGPPVTIWEPMDGSVGTMPYRGTRDRCVIRLRLERRQLVIVSFAAPAAEPTAPPAASPLDSQHRWAPAPPPPGPDDSVHELRDGWQAYAADGRPAAVPCLGDWGRAAGWDLFTGTVEYRWRGALPPAAMEHGRPLLDLGSVGEAARVTVNGHDLGARLWAPYRFVLKDVLHRGENRIVVRVTNSMANAYDGRRLPSGLMGPVVIYHG